jgi:hypothetical protein
VPNHRFPWPGHYCRLSLFSVIAVASCAVPATYEDVCRSVYSPRRCGGSARLLSALKHLRGRGYIVFSGGRYRASKKGVRLLRWVDEVVGNALMEPTLCRGAEYLVRRGERTLGDLFYLAHLLKEGGCRGCAVPVRQVESLRKAGLIRVEKGRATAPTPEAGALLCSVFEAVEASLKALREYGVYEFPSKGKGASVFNGGEAEACKESVREE